MPVTEKQKKRIIRFITAVLLCAVLSVLSACGGQTNSSGSETAQETVNAETGNAVSDEQQTEELLSGTAAELLQQVPEPAFGSVGGEWLVFGLSRWGGDVPDSWYESYYTAVGAHVEECQGILDEKKYTEYSRLVIALSAIGKDPANVAGYDMLLPLGDYEKTVFQGLNGAVYALIALDIGNYDVPAAPEGAVQATRQMYVDYILENESEEGGWAFAGGPPEPDMTAMVLQALSKYMNQPEVSEAVDRAVNVLSELQQKDGGYISFESDNSEAVSQVIVALGELGIPADDERFVKNGHTLEEKLLSFRLEDGCFKHTADSGEMDLLATEQAFYALVSLERQKEGMPSLYRLLPVV